MKLSRLSALLLLLAIPVVALAQKSEVDWIRGTDFSKFLTFTWAKAYYAVQDPYANLALATAVQDELAAKSLQFVPSDQKFDLFVTYTARINQDMQNLSQNILTINIRIFDASKNTVIWSAGGFTALSKDGPDNRKKARALVSQMLQKYPPE